MWKLLELLSILQDTPALRQNTLIVLAVHAELVPRLWFAYLKVLTIQHDSMAHAQKGQWLKIFLAIFKILQGCLRN